MRRQLMVFHIRPWANSRHRDKPSTPPRANVEHQSYRAPTWSHRAQQNSGQSKSHFPEFSLKQMTSDVQRLHPDLNPYEPAVPVSLRDHCCSTIQASKSTAAQHGLRYAKPHTCTLLHCSPLALSAQIRRVRSNLREMYVNLHKLSVTPHMPYPVSSQVASPPTQTCLSPCRSSHAQRGATHDLTSSHYHAYK